MKKSVLFFISFFIFGSAFPQNHNEAAHHEAELPIAIGTRHDERSLHHPKKPKPFSIKINGTTRNFQGKIIYVHHKWDDKDFVDSAKVDNNRFAFELKSYEPNMYWFTLTRDVNTQPNAVFFADDVTLNALVIGDSIASSVIHGGQNQKDYTEYRNIATDHVVQQQRLQYEFTLASQKYDRDLVLKLQQDYQSLVAQYNTNLKNFVKIHPKSAVSGYIIYKELSTPTFPLDTAVACLSFIDKSIENTKFVKLASKKINELKGTQIGAKATDFSQPTADGKQVKLSDFRGKYVLVDFWASWCKPCRMENPNVVAAYNNFKDKGFTVFGVSLDANREQWIAAVQSDHLTWTNVSDLKGGANDAATLYGILNIPQNILVDKEGVIVAKNLRGPALDEKLKDMIK